MRRKATLNHPNRNRTWSISKVKRKIKRDLYILSEHIWYKVLNPNDFYEDNIPFCSAVDLITGKIWWICFNNIKVIKSKDELLQIHPELLL